MRLVVAAIFAICFACNSFAQTPLWYPVVSGGGGSYGPPQNTGEEACYVSHQSYGVNAGIYPNKFNSRYATSGELSSMSCSWDRGGPGYWGTSGFAALRCPPGFAKSGDDNFCAPLETPSSCPNEGSRSGKVLAIRSTSWPELNTR